MANPFMLAAALGRARATIKCPYCWHSKIVPAKPAAHRVCPRCRRQFPDPLAQRTRRK